MLHGDPTKHVLAEGGPMPENLQINSINKSNRQSVHERIRFIGGTNPDGSRWKLLQPIAIEGMETGTWTFYVNVRDKPVKVLIAMSQNGNKYLITENDGIEPNNLLTLPECP